MDSNPDSPFKEPANVVPRRGDHVKRAAPTISEEVVAGIVPPEVVELLDKTSGNTFIATRVALKQRVTNRGPFARTTSQLPA